jgi:hypothetical protein
LVVAMRINPDPEGIWTVSRHFRQSVIVRSLTSDV